MICNIEISESVAIGKILKRSKALATTKVVKDIIDHVTDKDSLALKMTNSDGDTIGIWCSREFDDYVSLSFFYMDESVRRKPQVIVFFKHCYEMIDCNKPLIILAKDITGFERYVKQIDDNVYQFIGLR